MSNELLWVIMLVVTFSLLLLFYKLFGRPGLFAWICISTVVANIQVAITIPLFGMVATLGNIIYGTSFLATDILSEKYGRKEAQKGVYMGFLATIAVMIMMQICIKFTPYSTDFMMEHVAKIFTIFPRIVTGSLIAFLISQLHDTWAFEFWKNKFPKHLWIRNNASTLVSQAIDTTIFVTIAFYGVFEKGIIFDIAFSTYVIKLFVAVADTPFFYLASKIRTFVLEEN